MAGASQRNVPAEEITAAVEQLLIQPFCFAVASRKLFSRYDLVLPLEWRTDGAVADLPTLASKPTAHTPAQASDGTQSSAPGTAHLHLTGFWALDEASLKVPFAVDGVVRKAFTGRY